MDSKILVNNAFHFFNENKTNHYEFIEEIGSGSGGFVKKCKRLEDSKM